MKFLIDWWTIIIGIIAGVSVNAVSYFGNINKLIITWVIRLCVVVPKTSKFKEIKNVPLKHIKSPFPVDTKSLNDVLNSINKDPNLKYSGVNKELSIIIQCIFSDREELLVETMDFLVISKLGVEILIFEFENKSSVPSYDRSLFIDITSYRSTMFQYHGMIVFAFAILASIFAGNDEIRNFIGNFF